jgi:hypothetical protein
MIVEQDMKNLIEQILNISPSIRYVAIYQSGALLSRQREAVQGASESESDRYEELLVNPTLLLLAKQRGEIDCGGFRSLIISYGNFRQYVRSFKGGHISVCLENDADPIHESKQIDALLEEF